MIQLRENKLTNLNVHFQSLHECDKPMVGVACRAGSVPDDLNALEWRRSSGSAMCGERRT